MPSSALTKVTMALVYVLPSSALTKVTMPLVYDCFTAARKMWMDPECVPHHRCDLGHIDDPRIHAANAARAARLVEPAEKVQPPCDVRGRVSLVLAQRVPELSS